MVLLGAIFFLFIPTVLLVSITSIGDVEVVSQMSETLKVLPPSAQAQIEGQSDQGRTAYALAVFLLAPVAIVVCADADQSAARYHERGRELYCLQDTAAAATHILLAAVALGLGSCWIGAFDGGQAAAVLELPSRHRPVAILPIGRPAGERGGATSREPLESVATFLG